jgi:hypothetical protein
VEDALIDQAVHVLGDLLNQLGIAEKLELV